MCLEHRDGGCEGDLDRGVGDHADPGGLLSAIGLGGNFGRGAGGEASGDGVLARGGGEGSEAHNGGSGDVVLELR